MIYYRTESYPIQTVPNPDSYQNIILIRARLRARR